MTFLNTCYYHAINYLNNEKLIVNFLLSCLLCEKVLYSYSIFETMMLNKLKHTKTQMVE
jgi:hypothetical protein